MTATPGDVFVGRRDELAQLISALEGAEAGRGSLIMLAGEPGIGKTRIIEELCREALDGGARAAWGVSHQSAGAPPYRPWVQVIGALVRDRDPDEFHEQLGADAAVIAEIVPAVREKLPDLQAPTDLGPEHARFRLFDSVTAFLKNAAATQPIVLVLDDLHWADRSSLDLLEFVAREARMSPLLILGAYRDVELSRQHPLSASLAELGRERHFLRLSLRGLEREDTGRLVQAIGRFTPSQATVDAIHERTEGNPFFVSEVARDLAREAIANRGDLHSATRFRIPEGVREAIGARLNRLSGRCDEALRTASVIGREFDFGVLAAVAEGLSEEALLDALDEGLHTHVIRGLSGAGERYEFTHALIQQTFVDETSASRRARLHARIVDALEELHGDRVEEHVGELAYHCAEADAVVGVDKLAHYAQMAGERSLASYAFGEARAHFERAMAALEDGPRDARVAAILFGLGKAELRSLSYPHAQRGWDHVARAFDLYTELGDTQAAVAVAMQSKGYMTFWLHGTADVFSRALEMAAPNSAEAGHLLRLYAGAVRSGQEDAAASSKALEQALGIAKRTGDKRLEAVLLADLGRLRIAEHDFRGGVESELEAIELLRETDQAFEEVTSLVFLTSALTALGDPDAAWQHLEARRRLDARFYRAGGDTWNPYLLSYLRGDRAKMIETGEALERMSGDDSVVSLFVGIGASQAERQSDLEARTQAAYETAQTDPVTYQRSGAAAFLALAARLTDRPRDAARAGEAGRSLLSMPKLTPESEANARIALGLATVAAGDGRGATEHYRLLENLRGTLAIWALPMCGDRLLGLLAHVAGKTDEAVTHFEGALEFASEAGYRLEVGWTCHDYAEMLLDADGLPDREKALSLIHDGLELARELGMRTLESRLATLREKGESMPPGEPSFPDGLTGREVEVLRLIAAGMSNRQIAHELFISPNTAANHVRSILAKTECLNRTQAAAYANRHGLTGSTRANR